MHHILRTIGHSTRSIEEFIALLQAHGIRVLADVRSIPYSRRNPQFSTAALRESLREAGLEYRHLPALGGRRNARPDSVNLGWRSAGFRGYADYMQTDPFWRAIEELMRAADPSPTAIMCAEAVPWRCHRSLIADAFVSRGWTVRNILTNEKAELHTLTPFAKLDQGMLTYPAPDRSDQPSRLF